MNKDFNIVLNGLTITILEIKKSLLNDTEVKLEISFEKDGVSIVTTDMIVPYGGKLKINNMQIILEGKLSTT